MSQIEVKIMGRGYLLACPDGEEEELLQTVRRVDETMCRIRDTGKIRARDRIAVLAALNLAHEAQTQAAPEPHPPVASTPSPLPGKPQTADRESLQAILNRLDQALAANNKLL